MKENVRKYNCPNCKGGPLVHIAEAYGAGHFNDDKLHCTNCECTGSVEDFEFLKKDKLKPYFQRVAVVPRKILK